MPKVIDRQKPTAADRIAELEARVRVLEEQIAAMPRPAGPIGAAAHPNAWVTEVAGAFADDPTYDEAARLGAAWRRRENRKSLRELERLGAVDADPGHRSSDSARTTRRRLSKKDSSGR